MITAYRRTGSKLVEEEVAEGYTPAADTLWIDLLHPSREEEAALEAALQLNVPTREEMEEIESSSRLYRRDNLLYLTAVLPVHAEGEDTRVVPVSFVLGAPCLLTVRYDKPRSFPLFVSRALQGSVPVHDAHAVLLSLLGSIVDRCADILEGVAGSLDQLNRDVFRGTGNARRDSAMQRHGRRIDLEKRLERLLAHVGGTHSRVSLLRESVQSMQRLVGYMALELPTEKGTPEDRQRKVLERDLKSLQEFTDHLSNKLEFLLDAVLGLIALRQNQTIKLFSVISVVLMPPTLIASVYGMNFEHMPELKWQLGYPMALGAMLLAAVLPFLFFRYKRWF